MSAHHPSPSSRWRAIAVAIAAPAIVCIVHISCGDTSHIFQGRFYLRDRACLGTTSSIDVVEGDVPPSCPPACLAQPLADGGRSIYVSSMCAPYPYLFDASSSDPLCPPALDAWNRNDTCLSDGGSTHPASSDAEAGIPDGSATADASGDVTDAAADSD